MLDVTTMVVRAPLLTHAVVTVGVRVTSDAPDQEADPGKYEDRAHDVALLGLDLSPELKPDQSDDHSQNQ